MYFKSFDYHNETDEAAVFFKENGLVVFRNLTESKLFENVKAEIAELVRIQVKNNLPTNMNLNKGNGFDVGMLELSKVKDDLRRRSYEIIQKLPSLYKFGTQDSFQQITKDYGVKFPILRTTQVRMDIPEDERFLIPPHQEVKGIRSPNMVFMITALVDTPSRKGALKVSPGSFKLGPIQPSVSNEEKYQFIPPELYEEKYPIVQAELLEGETIVLNMYTIHGSSQNYTDETRWSLIVRYEDAENMPYLNGDDRLDTLYNLKG